MTPAEMTDTDIGTLARKMRAERKPFAIATVIRTVGATAAKPGAKAILDADGTILQGWIGGGCVKGALAKAAARAVAEGKPQLISLHPQDVLEEKGIVAGEDVDGVRFARNGCPSKGSIDIFVETVLPQPELVIFGQSPVARALGNLAEQFQWTVAVSPTTPAALEHPGFQNRMVVVATQGQADLDSLRSALAASAQFIVFVGSRRKFAALADQLIAEGIPQKALAKVQAPAGLHIGAVTPDEIALSILAQLTQVRRGHLRGAGGGDA